MRGPGVLRQGSRLPGDQRRYPEMACERSFIKVVQETTGLPQTANKIGSSSYSLMRSAAMGRARDASTSGSS